MSADGFTAGPADWRVVIRDNGRRTKMVMMTFILIYTAIGFLVDIVILMNNHPELTFEQAYHLLLGFQVIPWATISMLGVALLSLLVTIKLHDKIMLMGTDAHEITSDNAKDLSEKQLFNVIEEMKVAAGLRFMPKVYVINADYMNAFASGFTEKSAMVAITKGLMTKLNREELQAVMAHELSHVRHQDIKLTLMVGVLSNLMLMVVDVLFYNVIYGENNGSRNNPLFAIILLLRYGLPMVTMFLMFYLSRTREYMADSGAVELMRDNEPLARALLKIEGDHAANKEEYKAAYGAARHEEFRNAAYIFDPGEFDPVKSLMSLFSTHPSIEDRLKAIGFKMNKS